MSIRKVLSTLIAINLCMAVTLTFHVPNVSAADEFDQLRLRYVEGMTGGSSYDPSDPDITTRISEVTSNANANWSTLNKTAGRTYLWSDKPYGSDIRSNDISTGDSVGRLVTMAIAYKTKGSSLENNASLKDDIINAMEWIYTNKYNVSSPTYTVEGGHGWYKEIGTPSNLNNLIALMYDDFTSTQIENYLSTIDHFLPDPTRWIGAVSTGANRTDTCRIVVVRGILGKNSEKIIQGRDAMEPVFNNVTSGDGFYEDGSFIQHGKYAYTGGYGSVQVSGAVGLLSLLYGSTWDIVDPDKNNIYNWMFEGFEPLIHKSFMFDDVKGRSVARYIPNDIGTPSNVNAVINNALKLSQIPSSYQAGLKSWAKYLLQYSSTFYQTSGIQSIVWAKALLDDDSVAPRGDLSIFKQFSQMDVAVQQRPNYGLAISMHSTRTYNYEITNNENLKGWHQGDGWLQLADDDYDSYKDAYYQTIDSYRLPGTTVNQKTTYDSGKLSDKDWVGGTDMDGLYGATGMELHPNGQTLTAKKSWFMFDNEIVNLGSGITSSDNKNVETIIENKMINSSGNNELKANGTSKSAALGWSETMTGVNWAHLTGNAGVGTGYYFPGGTTTVNGIREARTGSSYDVSHEVGVPKDSFTRNYLTLWLDHGINPSNASYQYVLLPSMSSTEVENYAANPNVSILANTPTVQAVKESTLGITAANFWEAGTVDFIRSYQPVSVMIKEKGNELTLAVSDPTHKQSKLTLELGKIGTSVISKDDTVTVSRMAPYTRIEVDTSGLNGETHNVTLRVNTKAPEHLPPINNIVVNVPVEKMYRGDQTTVTVNVNSAGERTPGGKLSLNVPEGWSVEPANFAIPSLSPGESRAFTARLVVPADAEYGHYSVTAAMKSATVTPSASDQVEIAPYNIALGKLATQSSIAYAGVPGRAVDGDVNGAYSGGSVTHTNENSLQPWWQVDLGSSHPIEEIYIWNRSDSCCSNRLSNYYVLVSEQPFTNVSLTETLQQPGVWVSHQTGEAGRPTTVAVGQSGRYVRIQLEGKNALSLAEVQVISGVTQGR